MACCRNAHLRGEAEIGWMIGGKTFLRNAAPVRSSQHHTCQRRAPEGQLEELAAHHPGKAGGEKRAARGTQVGGTAVRVWLRPQPQGHNSVHHGMHQVEAENDNGGGLAGPACVEGRGRYWYRRGGRGPAEGMLRAHRLSRWHILHARPRRAPPGMHDKQCAVTGSAQGCQQRAPDGRRRQRPPAAQQ